MAPGRFRDLKLRLRAVFSPRQAERDLHDELSFHIERETRRLIDRGMTPDAARFQARARFGSVTVVGDECRDTRGIAFVDHTLRDAAYAIRAFVREPLASLTIVMTLAIGLGAIGVLFTVLNMMLFRVDNVPDINEMFAVERPRNEKDERQPLTRLQFEAMRRETRVFTDMYAEVSDVESRIDGRAMSGNLVTGNFFQVLGVHAAMGRTLLPSDDLAGAGHPVVVLSHRGWTRRLDSDPRAIGRHLLINGAPHEIIGVMPEGFRGLEVSAPHHWAPLSMLAAHSLSARGKEDTIGVGIVGRLMPGTSPDTARAQLEAWYSPQVATGTDRRAPALELLPRRGTVPQPIEAVIVFTPLFFAFGLILMIGCANVANLLLARGVARQKEIGILGIRMVRGRAFTDREAEGQLPVAIINESLARTMFPGADAIGQTIQIEPDLESSARTQDDPPVTTRTATVVGVSREVPGFRLSEVKEPSLYMPVHAGVARTSLVARVNGDADQARRTLLDRLIPIDPNMGRILTMRTIARMETWFLQIAFWATLMLGGLALSLTVSGLFSVLSYLVEQRTKEIGVRMALGATSKHVTRLVIAQTSRPVIVGLIGGTSFVLALATILLSIPTAGLIGGVVHVLDPIAYAGSLLVIVTACLLAASIPARRAARVDPMRSLRQD